MATNYSTNIPRAQINSLQPQSFLENKNAPEIQAGTPKNILDLEAARNEADYSAVYHSASKFEKKINQKKTKI